MASAYKEMIEYEKRNELKENLNKVKVIWYKAPEDVAPLDLFTRLNSYRIPLTNSELIRALFLRKDGQGIDEKRQFEIATEWDQIERELREPSFWYFLTSEEPDKYPSRIELIFKFMVSEKAEGKVYDVFEQFAESIRSNKAEAIWQRVSNCFNILHDWYHDPELYHLIGYLVAAKKVGDNKFSIPDLIREWIPAYMLNPSDTANNIPQGELLEKVRDKIRLTLPKSDWDNLRYGNNNNEITNILLLFNIIYTKDRGNKKSRFPFDGYKMSQWSLEHIHPQNPNMDNLRKNFRKWWEEHERYFPTEKMDTRNGESRSDKIRNTRNKIESFLRDDSSELSPPTDKLTDADLQTIFILVMNYGFNDENNVYADASEHSLENMALLQKEKNSSLQNFSFSVKRKKIIEMDKPKSGEEKFMLPCTLNVFLKYYSSKVDDMDLWKKDDRKEYLTEIKETLNDYQFSTNHE